MPIEDRIAEIEARNGVPLLPEVRTLLMLTYSMGFLEGARSMLEDEPEIFRSKLEAISASVHTPRT